MRTILLLAALGALAVPATAQATTVSPELQAELNQRGWTAGNDDGFMDSAMFYPLGATGDCAHSRQRHAGSALRYASGNPMVRGGVKLAVCANNGKITQHEEVYRHASPGRGWKQYLPPVHHAGYASGGLYAFGSYCWMWNDDRHLWDLSIRITAHVRGDHDIYFMLERKWDRC